MSQTSLTELLRLTSAPVAIAFVDAAPPGVPHVSAVEPAGCGYWRPAAAGRCSSPSPTITRAARWGRTRTT